MNNSLRSLCTVLIAVVPLAACTTSLLPPNVIPVAPKATSVAEADRMLAESARAQAEAQAEYAAAEGICYKKFFVNNCLDKAKEQRRERLAYLKAVENEAEYFKRKAKVEERDRKLAQAEKDFQAEQARLATEPAAPPKVEQPLPPSRPKLEKRKADHAAKVRQQAVQDQKMAAEAPANVAAFERRKAESAERQRRVAERQAAKAKEKAEKAAAAQKK